MDDLERRLTALADPPPRPPRPVAELRERARRIRRRRRLRWGAGFATAAAVVAAVAVALPSDPSPPRIDPVPPAGRETAGPDQGDAAPAGDLGLQPVSATELGSDLVVVPPDRDRVVLMGAAGRSRTVEVEGRVVDARPDGVGGVVVAAEVAGATRVSHLPADGGPPRTVLEAPDLTLLGVVEAGTGPGVLYTTGDPPALRRRPLDGGAATVVLEDLDGVPVAAAVDEEGWVLLVPAGGRSAPRLVPPAGGRAGGAADARGQPVDLVVPDGARVVDATLGGALALLTAGDGADLQSGIHLYDPPIPEPAHSAFLPPTVDPAQLTGFGGGSGEGFSLINRVDGQGRPLGPLMRDGGIRSGGEWRVLDIEGLVRLAPPGTGPAAPPPAETGLFHPPTETTGETTLLPVTFPDGTIGTLAYPPELGLARMGLRPGWGIQMPSPGDDPVPLRREVTAHRGSQQEILRILNGGQAPPRVAEHGDAGLYDLREGEDLLAFSAGGWTVTVPATREGRRLDAATLDSLGVALGGRETPAGFLVLELAPPLRRASHPDPALVFGPAGPGQVTVRASACTGGVEEAPTPGADEADWCQADEQVAFRVEGEARFVAEVRRRLRISDVTYPPEVIDPTWVTGQQRAAQDGSGAWVAVAFVPPDIAMDPSGAEPADLPLRWKPAEDGPQPSPPRSLARALTLLTGPPPPHLDTAWRGRVLELASARLEGGELVLDFTRLEAPAGGSHAAAVMALQFEATVAHYFPQAEEICVLEDGEPTFWLHDGVSCPSRADF